MSRKPQIPYITARSEETIDHSLKFAWSKEISRLQLTYSDPHPGDWALGVLWMRQGLTGQGYPEWKLVNTLRQRRCMLRKLCQVCGRSAVDQHTGRTWWVLADDADQEPATAEPHAAAATYLTSFEKRLGNRQALQEPDLNRQHQLNRDQIAATPRSESPNLYVIKGSPPAAV
jgi:hypothetical protein